MVAGRIDRLILCGPYDEPDKYWRWVSAEDGYTLEAGRRPPGYQSMSQDGTYGPMHPIRPVESMRRRVNEWRRADYPGVSRTTKSLLYHWTDPGRRRRLFFCQMEAIETLIYTAEANPGALRDLEGFEGDGSAFQRLCTKMATGCGKTVVMGMLIAWQVLNQKSRTHTPNVLVVAPGLTVRDRLQVLRPGHPSNIYDDFDLVPSRMRPALGSRCRISITNYHGLVPKSGDAPSREGRILKTGPEKPRHVARRILGGDGIRDILVINDEGHHAWRKETYHIRGGRAKREAKVAGMWMSGLDMIHAACNVIRCHDFSATPFVPTGRGSAEEALFTWIVSDFSLPDAIESGLVKTPRAVPEYDDSAYRHLYSDAEVRRHFRNNLGFHDKVRNAYRMMCKDWKRQNDAWTSLGNPVPPVLITVCNSVSDAKQVEEEMERNAAQLPGILTDEKSVLKIDSDEVEKAGRASPAAVDELRLKMNTVGRPGEPGGRICNIISVNMLTEG